MIEGGAADISRSKGVFLIGKAKDVNWNVIRADYITGSISQRNLAKKYDISINTLIKRANREKWNDQRNGTYNKITEALQQKTADVAKDNAVIAAEIKQKLLVRLNRILDEFPEDSATEVQKFSRSERKVYKLKDLTAMYKDLTADLAQADDKGSELLQSLMDLERRLGGD